MVFVLLLVSTAALAVWRTNDMQQRHREMDHTSAAATALEGAQGQFWLAQAALSALVISGDVAWVEDYDNALVTAGQDLAKARAEFLAMGEADKVAALDDLTGRIEEFNQTVRWLFPTIIEADRQSVIDLANSSMSQMTVTNRATIADLEEIVQEAQLRASTELEAADDAADFTLWLLLGLSGIALATGIVTIIGFLRSVVGPLATLRASARAITSGNPDARARVFGPEEVASLARDFNEMTDALAAKAEAVRESEGRYRLLAENATDLIWTMDLSLHHTYVSPSVTRLRGYSVEEAMAQTPQQELTPASLDVAMKALAEEMAREKLEKKAPYRWRTLELEHYCKDGSTIWLEVTTTFLRDEDGRATGLLGASRDISERKKVQESLEESERRYRLLAENASDIIWTMDMNQRFTYESPSVARIRGYSPEEAMAQTIEETLTPASVAVARETLAQELAPGRARDLSRSRTLELEHTCKDGTTVWLEVTTTFLRNEDGRPVGLLGASRDISERRQAEEELRQSEERFRQVGEASREWIWESDVRGRYTYSSPAVKDILGYDPEEVAGRNFLHFVAPEERELIAVLSRDIIDNKGTFLRATMNKVHKDGHTVVVESTGLPKLDAEGNVVGYRGVDQDVTERKRAEEELRRRNEELALFLDLSRALATSMEIDELIETALEGVSKVLPQADVMSVAIYDKDRDVLEIRSARARDRKARVRMAFKPGEATSGKVFQSGKSILYPSPEGMAAAWADLSPANLQSLQQAADEMLLQSAMCAPLAAEGKVLGSLFVATSNADAPFQQTDLALLEAASSHIAVALDKAQLHGQTKVRAITDGLTGLYNRTHFYERLSEEIERSGRYSGGFAVAMMDVDNFKRFNDSRGHQEGDKMLRLVADSIRSGLRRSDLAFRYGGDEFAAIMLHADAARARTVIDRINKRLAKSLKQVNDDAAARLSLSAGVACFGDHGTTADELVRVADAALYSAKWAAQTRHVADGEYAIESLAPPPAMAARGMLSTTAGSLAKAFREVGVPDVMAELNLRTIAALGTLAKLKDPYISGHQERTSDWAAILAEEMGLAPDRVRDIRLAGLVHDLGKAGVSGRILRKPGKLTEEEFAEIKEHPPLGSMMITSEVEALQQLVPIVRHHHERFDGKGYPDGLAGEEIPLEARILAVVDAFDAMTHERSYRKALGREHALAELRRGAGTQFDPAVVEVFLAWAAKEGEEPPARGQPASEDEDPAAVPTTTT